ncbi:hypothetical protein N7481_001475 [Penicillium waksmanii]|uniref:uncharacterized protein n=1 Tax=Penicillium waksmanii TaxID=69791 RepID=UPI002546BCAB|nr:uncharacterized protein N7481_001475 [Penicillium waksmanii]KAJ6001066.1 hypothetical protein N7481_001475 [Penicillium waksmanii]
METCSYGPEYEKQFQGIITNVIPQLLGPLQAHGRILRPTLVHGNLSDGNTATDLQTGKTLLLGASALYAHNEYELGMWCVPTVRFDSSFFSQYFKEFPPCQPATQWQDRLVLYSLKFNLMYMVKCAGSSLIKKQYALFYSFSILANGSLRQLTRLCY